MLVKNHGQKNDHDGMHIEPIEMTIDTSQQLLLVGGRLAGWRAV